MVEALPLAGLFALACTLQDVDPISGSPVSEPHAVSLVARDGTGTLIGWHSMDGQDRVSVRRGADGTLILEGLSTKIFKDAAWAILKPDKDGSSFEMTWYMYSKEANDGRLTAATWSKGTCHQLAYSKSSQ